jgi:hypothetical protein
MRHTGILKVRQNCFVRKNNIDTTKFSIMLLFLNYRRRTLNSMIEGSVPRRRPVECSHSDYAYSDHNNILELPEDANGQKLPLTVHALRSKTPFRFRLLGP